MVSPTLLAFCEGRLGKGNDWSDMDLIMRRSTDNGNNWEPMQVIIPRSPGRPTSNITPIVDKNGTIHLLYHVNYATAYYMKSDDDGKTWTNRLILLMYLKHFTASIIGKYWHLVPVMQYNFETGDY
jgi:sialidase-1